MTGVPPGPRDRPIPAVEPPPYAPVVIVGGGVIGVSVAFHLAQAGVAGVVVVERDRLGAGSSAKPLGGVRATFSDPSNIALGQRSLEAFETFTDRFGTDIGLRQVGYLFLCRTDAELAQVEQSTAVQHRLGGSATMISPARAAELNPLLDPRRLTGASFSPRDGYAVPAQVVAAYAAAARTLGVTFCEQTQVCGIGTADGTVRDVQTSRGPIRTETVVCAAGAWSARIGAMAGVHLPVVPVRRQIGLTPETHRPFPEVPFTLDLGSTMYFHNYPGGMLLGVSDRDQPAGFERDFDRSWVSAFDGAAAIVAPSLAGRPLVGGWAGLYENTPDHNAMIGRHSALDGFFCATGFSGHGFLQAPAVGEIVTNLYRGGQPLVDLTPFDPVRFETGRSNAGVVVDRAGEVHII